MKTEEITVSRGKPADYGQEIVKRRFRLTAQRLELGNKTVLDFGCGNGAQTVEFLNSGCHMIAVDIDGPDLSVLQDYIAANNITSIVPMQYDGHTLPLQSASVDIVVSYEVIEHVEDESQTLDELHRVLRPEGHMMISVPNKGWVFETHGAHLPLLPWNRVPFFSWLPRAIHKKYAKARIYRKSEIAELLQAHSFEVLEALYITAPMDVVRIPWMKKLLRATLFSGDTTTVPFLSTSVLVHCKRT